VAELVLVATRPPQTSIALPVQTAVWLDRGDGAPTVVTGDQASLAGS
jgi:hypothetical protein